MASEKKGNHYELTLEDRHLLGVFFAVVVLCAVFFVLGFVLGRNQAAAPSTAAPPATKPPAGPAGSGPSAPAAPPRNDLSFYQRVEGKPPAETVPASPHVAKRAPAPAPARPSPPPAVGAPPAAVPIHLQVAAVTTEPDAQRLAGELRRLGFPAVVLPPRADRFYRVQVGPFETAELADAARRRLEAQGFRDIVRR